MDELLARVQQHFTDSERLMRNAGPALGEPIVRAGRMLATALGDGKRALCCGNGGSAADAQHFSAELLNRFRCDRPPLAAVALTTDSSTLTAIANDFAWEEVFAKQVRGLGQPGDVLVAISTSGMSENVNRAVVAAQEQGLTVIGLTGRSGGRTGELLRADQDVEIRVPSEDTARIQEVHGLVVHCLCDLVDTQLFGGGADRPRER